MTSTTAASALIGQPLYDRLSAAAVQLYNEAASYALSRGVVLADTKFEFGLTVAGRARVSLVTGVIYLFRILTIIFII